MNKIYDFIKNCECFYVATINDEFPAVRPFGAIMEVSGFLYIATHDGNISNCPDHLHLGGDAKKGVKNTDEFFSSVFFATYMRAASWCR